MRMVTMLWLVALNLSLQLTWWKMVQEKVHGQISEEGARHNTLDYIQPKLTTVSRD